MSLKAILSIFIVFAVNQILAQVLTSAVLTSDGCSVTKGCYRKPSTCQSSTDCDFMVTYKADQKSVSFEVSAKATKWVALGFNTVPAMKGSTGEICMDSAAGPVLKGFHNFAQAPPVLYTKANQVTLTSLKVVNGAIICRFTRSIKNESSYQMALDRNYNFIVAAGNALNSAGGPQYHTSRVATPLKYNAAFVAAAPIGTVTYTVTRLSVSPTASQSQATSQSMTVHPTAEPAASTSTMATPLPSAEPSSVARASVTPSAEPSHVPMTVLPSASAETPSASVTTPKPSPVPTTKPNSAAVAGPTIFAMVACLMLSKLCIL